MKKLSFYASNRLKLFWMCIEPISWNRIMFQVKMKFAFTLSNHCPWVTFNGISHHSRANWKLLNDNVTRFKCTCNWTLLASSAYIKNYLRPIENRSKKAVLLSVCIFTFKLACGISENICSQYWVKDEKKI